MMYPYMVLEDKTGVLHSEVYDDGGDKKVEVHFQRPKEDGEGYDIAYCILPEYKWTKCEGFDRKQLGEFELFLRDNVYWIYQYAEKKE